MRHLCLLTLLLFGFHFVIAQPSLHKLKVKTDAARALQQDAPTTTLATATQASLIFHDREVTVANIQQWLAGQLEMRDGIDALVEEGLPANAGNSLQVTKMQQYFKRVRVEHGVVNTTAGDVRVVMANLEFYSIPDKFGLTPSVTAGAALQVAMQHTKAARFVWEDYKGNDPEFLAPKGELVIVRTYADDSTVCLAWKFRISGSNPTVMSNIYVNATTGEVVLDDPLIKHGNVTGTAATRYSGTQTIVTDDGGLTPGKPFKLKQQRNGHLIATINYQQMDYHPLNDPLAVEFSDNDNNWTAAEYNNANMDNAALDAHFNAQIVSDYWKEVHLRNSWDNNNGPLAIYIHVNEKGASMDNAFWNGVNLHMGDGAPGGNPPSTSLDDIAHELGHGITTATSNLVYRWESGAINEGFSDVWAACVSNFAQIHYPSLSSELTWRLFEKSSNPTAAKPGLRDMKDPNIFNHPKEYNGTFYRPATYQTCPVTTNNANNDHCGVHTNSGVFNRWFYLVTQGDMGTDPLGNPYNIAGVGFGESQKIAYLTTLNLTPNATFSTARIVSSNATAILYGGTSAQLQTVKSAWVAIGVDSNIYDMSNTPIFTTNNITAVAVGKDGVVWAGTNYNGLYTWDGTDWTKRAEIANVRINDIKADKAGGIWIAQSGTQASGSAATAGGVNYFPSTTATPSFYTVSTQVNVPSRNARCIFVDTSRTNDGPNPKVWVATMNYILNGNSASGMLGQGLYSASRYFRAVNEGLNVASNTAGTLTVGGNRNEIWTFAQANNGVNQILVYNAGTNALIATYDHTNTPAIPSGFVARAIYFDVKKRGWIGLANGGVLVFDEKRQWHQVNFPSVFPAGTQVNFNAITGDLYGDVYIGTTAGLVFFDHGIGENERLTQQQNYKLYTTANGLPSNQVNAIAYDTLRFRVWVATNQGIARWEPICLGKSCDLARNMRNTESATQGSGNWSDPSIWSSGMVPDSFTNVLITDTVTVDVDGKCQSLAVDPGGRVNVAAGKKLQVYEEQATIIYGRGRSRSRAKPR